MTATGARAAPNKLVAEIKMFRTQHTGSFLVLEGKDDVRFWEPRSHDSCRLVDGNGKTNVVHGLLRLDEIEFAGALGLVDSNHDHLAGRPMPSANLVATDAHDLECMLCRSSALNTVLAEFGQRDKIDRFERESGTDVRTALLEQGLAFGRLRWAARRRELGVALPTIRRFVDEKSWSVNLDQVIREMAALVAGLDETTLQQEVARLPQADPWHIVRGHDLMELLRIGLRRRLGNLPASTGVKEIARVLRSAMPPEELRSTRLWEDMTDWEGTNAPYRVLAPLAPSPKEPRWNSK